MKAVGIVAEYNPFHNGHLYHLNKVKELFPNEVVVLILSGHFLERGTPSIIDKWKRTQVALTYGVDLVVELPFPFACQSADFFAKGAISLLDHLKVSHFVFGSESNDLESIQVLVDTQLEHPEFSTLASIYLKSGENYPTALSKALFDLTGKRVNLPNDLLAISYLKEIKQQNSNIEPHSIQRTNAYHDQKLSSSISSATAIREALKQGQSIKKFVPKESFATLQEDLHFEEDYFPFLKYKIMTSQDLSIYQGVDEGIEHRLKKEIVTATSWEDLILKIKTKRYTYNKISRMLTHILCNFTKEEAQKMQEISYIRILGFNDLGRKYLNQIKKEVSIPLVTKFKREQDPMLDLEQRISSIYALPIKDEKKKIHLIEEEYKHRPNL